MSPPVEIFIILASYSCLSADSHSKIEKPGSQYPPLTQLIVYWKHACIVTLELLTYGK